MQKLIPFLMFTGRAEEAMTLYTSLFPNSEIISITRHEASEGGDVGSVMKASFSLNGQEFMCIDSAPVHDFTFTPSMSVFVNCDEETNIDTLFQELSKDGKVMMPLDTYPFSKKYAWLSDRFGVSWQLSANG